MPALQTNNVFEWLKDQREQAYTPSLRVRAF